MFKSLIAVSLIHLVLSQTLLGRDVISEDRIQNPNLPVPSRGSIAGDYADGVASTGSVLSKGDLSISLMSTPEDRAPLLFNPFPSYSARNGLTHWGMGWASNYKIERFNKDTDLTFDNSLDQFNSPYGVLVKGRDGYFYPQGLMSRTRVELAGDSAVAYLSDGATHHYRAFKTGEYGYAEWFLVEARSKTGFITKVSYAHDGEISPYIETVEYGARESHSPLYKIKFDYAALDNTISSFKYGYRQVLDRRVSSVHFYNTNHEVEKLRWSWLLEADLDETSVGFYLKSLEKKFPSGVSEPKKTFRYDLPQSHFDNIAVKETNVLNSLIDKFGKANVSHRKLTFVDVNNDGQTEIEMGTDNSIWTLENGSYTGSETEHHPKAFSGCRRKPSPRNKSRVVVRMTPNDNLSVIDRRVTSLGNIVIVCNPNGEFVQSVKKLSQNLSESNSVRFTDVNKDGKPDFVKIMSTIVRIYVNTSENGRYSFEEVKVPIPASLSDSRFIYVNDINGDGNVDLISVNASAVEVLYGKGGLQFASQSETIGLLTPSKRKFFTKGFNFTFNDLNQDGLADIILTKSDKALVFFNKASHFSQHPTAKLPITAFAGDVFISDLLGNGIDQIFKPNGRGTIDYVELGRASSNLLVGTSDGKGNRIDVKWKMSDPEEGIGRRFPVVASITHSSIGHQEEAFSYDYKKPTSYTRKPMFLGFNQVVLSSNKITKTKTFSNNDQITGLPLETKSVVPQSPIAKFETSSYSDSDYQGLSLKLLSGKTSGWIDGEGNQVETSERIIARDENLCPTQTKTLLEQGSLDVTYTYKALDNFSQHFLCLAETKDYLGEHPRDPQFNFKHLVKLEYNDSALLTGIFAKDGDKSILQQNISYDSMQRVERLSEPNGNWLKVNYEGHALTVKSITDASGYAQLAERFDSDFIRKVSHNRGAAKTYDELFTPDDYERLGTYSHSLVNGLNEVSSFSYKFASEQAPGVITTTNTKTKDIVSVKGVIVTGLDKILAETDQLNHSTLIKNLNKYRNNDQIIESYVGDPQSKSPTELTSAELFENAQLIGASANDALAHSGHQIIHYQEGIEGKIETKLAINPQLDLLQFSSTQSGYTRKTSKTGSGSVAQIELSSGRVYHYKYDVLNRLRHVMMPSGLSHKVEYDSYGRISRIDREDVGAIAYTYDDKKNQITKKEFFDKLGVLDRSESMIYDSIGRLKAISYEKNQSKVDLEYGYDGLHSNGTIKTGQMGFVSHITGPQFSKDFTYRLDGKLTQTDYVIDQTVRIEKSLNYFSDGDIKTQSVSISGLDNNTKIEYSLSNEFNEDGLLKRISSTQGSSVTIGRNNYGNIQTLSFSDGTTLSFLRDGLTRGILGKKTETQQRKSLEYSLNYNDRGFVDYEAYKPNNSENIVSYTYTEDGFLESHSSAEGSFFDRYSDDAFLVDLQNAAFRTTFDSPFVLKGHVFDSLNRIKSNKGLTFVYGPQGQLTTANGPSKNLSFSYDENGHRILKKSGNRIDTIDADGLLIHNKQSFEAIVVDGNIVGMVLNGEIKPLLTDARGSLLSSDLNSIHRPTPYGSRDVRSDMSPFLDYALKGYDRDLGMVRMGVRDYLPLWGRFTTADPLFFEKPEFCIESPIECNLYSYAKNNPLKYVDTSGLLSEAKIENQKTHMDPNNLDTFGKTDFTVSYMHEGERINGFFRMQLDESGNISQRDALTGNMVRLSPDEYFENNSFVHMYERRGDFLGMFGNYNKVGAGWVSDKGMETINSASLSNIKGNIGDALGGIGLALTATGFGAKAGMLLGAAGTTLSVEAALEQKSSYMAAFQGYTGGAGLTHNSASVIGLGLSQSMGFFGKVKMMGVINHNH
ncbi:RHS repeat-associated core domain-containing protein [Pseudobacteriovorax antillogorgiicola]|uniref:RHS repeat-associated core domain-containing protein n=1 Tax=Pseudobacteriovorax antillogorgiicola TaxID=1513793 RepID=A0A1Y6CQ33_9BACT|nr:FG-GAP-like repeat-containing protein [Pseudobacteriovorax antillogorgiicola]TCS51625.1 RHS repeat-associated protein [Pseudobacteriovorax antillogorgiicola]SMF81509.1 RHS repeat-associated core domain-containing protein [Pseudobacteriovorax antillogorgiicola]